MDERRKDYWRIGPIYVRRELFLLALAAVSAAVLAVFGLPLSPPRPPDDGPPAYRYDDAQLADVSGVVRLLDSEGRVRYEGEVEQGSCTGRGRVFDPGGQLVYDGPLAGGVYEGADARVYQNGALVYEGEMADGLYHGEGRRVDPASGVVSEGQFVRGRLEGRGREYSAGGALLREGSFARDLLDGQGVEYGPDGLPLREGSFSAGLLHGQGVEYSPGGTPRYEGQFRRGEYHGQGTLYDGAGELPRYQGGFVRGLPLGLGTLFHPSGQPLYTGQVYGESPRADAFLGLSLAEVEAAFTAHWTLYSCGGVTAFVYPDFQLMFITDSPVELASPSGAAQRGERERRELLDALSAGAGNGPAEETVPARGAAPPSPSAPLEEPMADEVLSPDTDKSAVIITQALSYGRPLPGVAQPDMGAASGRHAAGWREWFSSRAMGWEVLGARAEQAGPLAVRFFPQEGQSGGQVNEFWAQDAGLEILSVWQEGKGMGLWYQTVGAARSP